MRYDIVVISGGIIGSSIDYHLAHDGRAGEVAVIERDPSYGEAAPPRGSGGIRRLFSLPENVAMSGYGLPFYQNFSETMAVPNRAGKNGTGKADPADISFRRQGYLFVSDGGDAAIMEANFRDQEGLGVKAELLDGPGLSSLFPAIRTDDVDLAVYSPDDAWIDAYAALQGFKRKARNLGVSYRQETVEAADFSNAKIKAVTCASGERIEADLFILAAGAWSGALGTLLGIDLPVEPMSRESYFFRCAAALEPLPFIKTETDLAFHPEGTGYTGGLEFRTRPYPVRGDCLASPGTPGARDGDPEARTRLARSLCPQPPGLQRHHWSVGDRAIQSLCRYRFFRSRHHAPARNRPGDSRTDPRRTLRNHGFEPLRHRPDTA